MRTDVFKKKEKIQHISLCNFMFQPLMAIERPEFHGDTFEKINNMQMRGPRNANSCNFRCIPKFMFCVRWPAKSYPLWPIEE